METQRRARIENLLQRELAEFFNHWTRESTLSGILISVTKVRITVDLSIAKVYLSVFPSKNAEGLLQNVLDNKSAIKHRISIILKHQLRKIPEISYYIDDSLDYIEGIESALVGDNDPVQNPDLLGKRKRI